MELFPNVVVWLVLDAEPAWPAVLLEAPRPPSSDNALKVRMLGGAGGIRAVRPDALRPYELHVHFADHDDPAVRAQVVAACAAAHDHVRARGSQAQRIALLQPKMVRFDAWVRGGAQGRWAQVFSPDPKHQTPKLPNPTPPPTSQGQTQAQAPAPAPAPAPPPVPARVQAKVSQSRPPVPPPVQASPPLPTSTPTPPPARIPTPLLAQAQATRQVTPFSQRPTTAQAQTLLTAAASTSGPISLPRPPTTVARANITQVVKVMATKVEVVAVPTTSMALGLSVPPPAPSGSGVGGATGAGIVASVGGPTATTQQEGMEIDVARQLCVLAAQDNQDNGRVVCVPAGTPSGMGSGAVAAAPGGGSRRLYPAPQVPVSVSVYAGRPGPIISGDEFVCHEPDCGRTFKRKTSLTNHLKAHRNKNSRPIRRYKRLKRAAQQHPAVHSMGAPGSVVSATATATATPMVSASASANTTAAAAATVALAVRPRPVTTSRPPSSSTSTATSTATPVPVPPKKRGRLCDALALASVRKREPVPVARASSRVAGATQDT